MDGDTLTLPPHRMMEQFADINVAGRTRIFDRDDAAQLR